MSDNSELEGGMTTDGDEAQKRRAMQIEIQENASKELLDEMRQERDDLVEYFEKDTDLSKKVLISGVRKVCVLGVIKYHQIR